MQINLGLKGPFCLDTFNIYNHIYSDLHKIFNISDSGLG